MSRSRSQPSVPACYALVHPGLETIAAEEIENDLGGEVKKTGPGIVVFRLPEIDARVLKLRTTEDVFLLAWGSDQLSCRAEDLDRIRRWTAREADWPTLLRIHHTLRPKPKGTHLSPRRSDGRPARLSPARRSEGAGPRTGRHGPGKLAPRGGERRRRVLAD